MILDLVLLAEELIQSYFLWLGDTRGQHDYFPGPWQADMSLLWLHSGLVGDACYKPQTFMLEFLHQAGEWVAAKSLGFPWRAWGVRAGLPAVSTLRTANAKPSPLSWPAGSPVLDFVCSSCSLFWS